MVENPPSSAGDASSFSGWETKIPYAMVQLSPHTTADEPKQHKQKEALCCDESLRAATKSHVPQPGSDAAKNKTSKYLQKNDT